MFAAEFCMPGALLREHFSRRFGGIVDRAAIGDDEAFVWTVDELKASELKKMEPVELAMVLAKVRDSFVDAGIVALTDLFGLSAIAVALQLVDLGLVI